MIDSRMLMMIPQIFFTGVSIAFYTGLFVTFIFKTMEEEKLDENELFGKSMNVMSLIGIGALLGTLGIGYIHDKLGSRASCTVNLVLMIIA